MIWTDGDRADRPSVRRDAPGTGGVRPNGLSGPPRRAPDASSPGTEAGLLPAVSRTLVLVTTSMLAALTAAPAFGASAVPLSAPDGVRARPYHQRGVTAHAAQAAAGDPRAIDQWALQGDAAMGIESAWRQTTGADVTVAIVDSGIAL